MSRSMNNSHESDSEQVRNTFGTTHPRFGDESARFTSFRQSIFGKQVGQEKHHGYDPKNAASVQV